MWKSRKKKPILALKLQFSTVGNFCPQETFGNFRGHFGCHIRVGQRGCSL